MSIYVGNLSYDADEEHLKELFASYGTVKSAKIPVDRETGRKRGFGFVEMSTDAEEAAAIAALDGTEDLGRTLKVNKSEPQSSRERRPMDNRGGRSRDIYGERDAGATNLAAAVMRGETEK